MQGLLWVFGFFSLSFFLFQNLSYDPRVSPPVFDCESYLSYNSDLRALSWSCVEAQNHWLQFGISEGRRGSFGFSAMEYLKLYPDVRNAYGPTGYASALDHFIGFGINEGRIGRLAFSPLVFNLAEYRELNPSLASLNDEALKKHWVETGVYAGLMAKKTFSSQQYLQIYPDLNAAFRNDQNIYFSAVQHFVLSGYYEGRVGRYALHPLVFDVNDYRRLNPSLAGMSDDQLRNHWLTIGMKAGLIGKQSFSAKEYISAYRDLYYAFGPAGYEAAVQHFVMYSPTEGRLGRSYILGNIDSSDWDQALGAWTIKGWSCQPGNIASLGIRIYAGSDIASAAVLPSSTSYSVGEAAINNSCQTSGAAYRFTVVIAKKAVFANRGSNIYVQALHVQADTADSYLSVSNTLFTKMKFPVLIPYRLSELASNGLDLVIQSGHEVTIDKSVDVKSLMIMGRLICPTNGDFTIKATEVHIMGDGSTFECGTPSKPYPGKLKISLKPGLFLSGCNGPQNPCSDRNFMVMSGGKLQLIGSNQNANYQKLTQTANPGDTQISLTNTYPGLSAIPWSVGDRIAIAPTNFNYLEAEEVTVTGVSGNTVRFTPALRYKHFGNVQTLAGKIKSWTLDERATVGNLTRNIKIETDNANPVSDDYKGAHLMIMRTAKAYIDSVEFAYMGRMGELARYPFHWHRAGDGIGQYIINSSVHHSYHRCITVHGTNNTLVSNNICFDHYGHGFFLEDGDETGNSLIANLGMLTRKPLPDREILFSDIADFNDRFPGPATFWISNPNNRVVNNIAAGSRGSGFWMSFHTNLYCEPGFCEFKPNPQIANDPRPANVHPSTEALLQFEGNVAHSNRMGMAWDGVEEGDPRPNPRNPKDRITTIVHYDPPAQPFFRSLVMFKNWGGGMYFRGIRGAFDNLLMADNWSNIFLSSNQVVRNSAIIAMSNNFVPADLDFMYTNLAWGYPYLREIDFTYISGANLYDGPMELTNIDFINFPSQPIQYRGKNLRVSPLFLIGGANRGTNFVKNLRFTPEPAQRVDFSCLTYTGTSESPWGCGWLDSNTSESIRDTDGTLSGVANSVLVPDNAFNMDSACTRFSPGVLRCNYKAGLFFFLNKRNGVSEVDHTNFVVKRSDNKWSYDLNNATELLMKSLYNNKFGVIADKGYSYEVHFLPGPNQTVWTRPNEFKIQFQTEGNIGDVSPVVILKNIGTNCRAPDSLTVAATSLNELMTANRGMYFSSGQDLYLRQKTYVQYFLDPQDQTRPISSAIRTVSSLPSITCD